MNNNNHECTHVTFTGHPCAFCSTPSNNKKVEVEAADLTELANREQYMVKPTSPEDTWSEIEKEFDSRFDYLNARHTNEQWDEYKDFFKEKFQKEITRAREEGYFEGQHDASEGKINI